MPGRDDDRRGVDRLARRSSRPTDAGGLGFGFKWNMGWMHDTLRYMARDPVHRSYHHDELTSALVYAFTENFVLPLSHDEVVHGKGSLLGKMPGDDWQRFANLRAALRLHVRRTRARSCCSWAASSRQWREWNHDASLDWHLLERRRARGVQRLVARPQPAVPRPRRAARARLRPGGLRVDRRTTTPRNSVFAFVRRDARRPAST